jgi:hypothetical protein
MKSYGVLLFVCMCVEFAQARPPTVIPQVVNSGAWKTDIVLVNPATATITGKLQFFRSDGRPSPPASYSVSAKGTVRINAESLRADGAIGSLHILPDAGNAGPSAASTVSRIEQGKTVQEISIPATMGGRTFRFHGEVIGTASHVANAVRTGVAIANPLATPVKVSVRFSPQLNTSFVLNGHAQISVFIDQLPGMTPASLRAPFSGMVQMTSTADVAVVVLRGVWKSPDEFRTTWIPLER